ncbi:site-2 protease family protein [Dyadobacter sp. CY356]|uniref:site-2 protease family protein n=1 Tax=Dyadobacter sp. CY356 TaxID=2906442 RepID=UPI001F2F121F|nr:site-2 protease family protein [Dyadobacter sp. CY356]MCF0054356.1 site-2 protease family protein [Dyadobacter sp. CY356]
MGEIDNKLLYQLILGFFITTIVATIVHEYGHFFTAKLLGYDAKVSYGYTTWTNTAYQDFIDSLSRDERIKIRTNEYFSKKEEYEALLERIKNETFLITLSGPLLTIIIGTLGSVILFFNRKSFDQHQLSPKHWVLLFIAFFWLRQPANYVLDLLSTISRGRYPYGNDETVLARYLGFDIWSISFILAVAGLAVVYFIYRKFIPDENKTTFLLAGLIGGLGGYMLWLFILGPAFMP